MAEKILILEDDQETLRLLQTTLVAEEFEIVATRTAAEARNILFSRPVDLIILNRKLPDQDGLDFVKEIKLLPPFRYTGVVFLGVRSLLQEKIDGFMSGADDYITKPFFPEEFVSRIKAILKFISPMLHPLSHLPGPLACQKECAGLNKSEQVVDPREGAEGPARIEFVGIVLSEYERFRAGFPGHVRFFFNELAEIFYKAMAAFGMKDFLTQLEDDVFLLMSRDGRGEMLLDLIKKNFVSLRKKALRQSTLDYFKKTPDNLLNLKSESLNMTGDPRNFFERIMARLRELKKGAEPLASNDVTS